MKDRLHRWEKVERSLRRRLPWLFVGLFLALAFAKTPMIFMAPRFWAEEGNSFFSAFQGRSVLNAVTHLFLGSYQALTNAAVYASTLVPLWLAPTITTYLAVAMHATVALQLAWFTRVYRLPLHAGLMLLVAWVVLPQTYEVWLSTTNAQWVAGVSVLLFLAMPADWLKAHAKGAAVWLFVCGLSGVPSTLVAPAFLLRAVISRERVVMVLAGVLTVCLCLQATLAVTHNIGDRAFVKSPLLLGLPFLMQTVIEPFSGADVISHVGYAIIGALPSGGIYAAVMIVLGMGMLALTVVLNGDVRRNSAVGAVLAAWLSVTLAQTFAALGDVTGHIRGNSGRYYLFGAMCLCLMLGWGASSADRVRRHLSVGALALVVLSGLAARLLSPSVNYFLSGPRWSDQVSACPIRGECILKIWPEGWTMTIVR